MYEQEKNRISHLIILICFSVFSLALTGESVLLDWNMGAVMSLLLGVAISWIIHITGRVPEEIRVWFYFVMTLLAFFFYGSHESSMYDMTSVIIMTMLVYSIAEKIKYITYCLITYYVTLLYDIFIVCRGNLGLSPLVVTRLFLHMLLVYVSGYLIRLIMKRKSEEQKLLNERITALEEINHRTEQFLTNVSHELRTPINVVTGITTVMIKNEADPEKKKDIVAIQNAGHRLFQQIEDILDYMELDTGRIKISQDTYMMTSIFNDIIAEAQNRVKASALEVVLDLDPSVPASFVGDGRKIKKMIRHLLDNSIKFTKEGGVYVRISTVRKQYGVNLCIQVNDTGIGVAEEQLEKIREKFYQSQNGKMRRAGGLGLGLSIVYGMTMAMHGFIRMESKEGEGTSITISIPQSISDEAPCMSLTNQSELCAACYLKPEKYATPQVRDYFNMTIAHLIKGLDLSVHRVVNRDELANLVSSYCLTHLFVGEEEYEEDKEYFEKLADQMEVIVVVRDSSSIPRESKVKTIRKPFYSLSVVNILNASDKEREEMYLERHILCPGLKVLVVDDEPMNLMVAEGIFKEYQMEVTTAESGIAAVELCRRESYDLVFLDHMMPEMDGIETLKLLRKLSTTPGKKLTVVAFTANAVSGAREMFRQEGFDEFISKPIEDVELERVLKRVLPRSAYVYSDEAEEKTERSTNGTEKRFYALENGGISTRSGVNYCRGDEAFYFELLTKFAQDAEQKTKEMEQFLQAEDCDNYRIRVHALKSTSKMIGASAFSEIAKVSEEAAKEHNIAYIKAHQENLVKAYWSIVHCIEQALDLQNEVKEQEARVEITREELLSQLKELQACLSTFEADRAEEMLKKLEEEAYQGTPLAEMLAEVKTDIENFDFGEGATKVAALIEKTEGGEVE